MIVKADFADSNDFVRGGSFLGKGEFLFPVFGRDGTRIQAGHLEKDAGMAFADFPHGGPLVGIHVGLDHFSDAGLQGSLNGFFRIRKQPLVVEMSMCIHKHRYKYIQKKRVLGQVGFLAAHHAQDYCHTNLEWLKQWARWSA